MSGHMFVSSPVLTAAYRRSGVLYSFNGHAFSELQVLANVNYAWNPRGPDGGSHRVSRGGGWGNDVASSFRGAFRYGIDPGYRRVNLGFRLLRIVS
jgi:formylglycine-generating enzyme required for sulfatase activity